MLASDLYQKPTPKLKFQSITIFKCDNIGPPMEGIKHIYVYYIETSPGFNLILLCTTSYPHATFPYTPLQNTTLSYKYT